jgi:hypothetical protein
MSSVTNYLGPEEIAAYGLRQQNADDAYRRGLVKLAQSRDWSAQDYRLNAADLTRQWDGGFRRIPSAFARRGVLRSGISNRGYGEYDWRRQMATRDLNRNFERQQAGFDQQGGDLSFVNSMVQRQIDVERMARQASLAAAIRGVQ